MGVATAIGIGMAVGSIVGSTVSASKQSSAAKESAKIGSDATTHAADLQSKANDDALTFQKQQASVDQQNQEQSRRANYDQWAARERRLSSFGQMVGLPSRDIPDYVASTPANYNSTPAPTIAGAANAPGGDYRAQFEALTGGKPLDQAGLLALAPQLQQAGFKITPPSAAGLVSKVQAPDGTWVRVLNGDPSVAAPTVWIPQGGAGGAAGATSARAGVMGTPAAYGQIQVSPGLQMPTFSGMVR